MSLNEINHIIMQDLLKIAVTFWHRPLWKFKKNEKSILFYLFFPCPPLEKIYALVILVFPQVTSVGKNSKNISRLGVASPRKPFFSFFPTSAKPWGNTKITRGQFFPQAEKGKKVKQNTTIKATPFYCQTLISICMTRL